MTNENTRDAGCAFDAARLDGLARRRFALAISALFLLLLALSVAAVGMGRFGLAPADLLSTLAGEAPSRAAENVVWNVRLPRVALALLAGSGLALSGAAFQSLFANPLASPDTLGVATGASFGAVLGILWGFPGIGIQAMSLASGLLAMGIVLLIARTRSGTSILMTVLAGIVTGALLLRLFRSRRHRATLRSGTLRRHQHALSHPRAGTLRPHAPFVARQSADFRPDRPSPMENLTYLFGVQVRIREVPTSEKIVTCVAAVKLDDVP